MQPDSKYPYYAYMKKFKWELFKAAVGLFADNGYSSVSVRDIANTMGTNQANIYNYFQSKDSIIDEAFKFYTEVYTASLPTLKSLIASLETVPPEKILNSIQPLYTYDKELSEIMPKILLVAIAERRNNPAAHKLFKDVFVDMPKKYVGGILREMIRRDMIEPLNVSDFLKIYSSFDLCSSLRMGGDLEIPTRAWRRGHRVIFSLLKFKNQ